MPDQRTYLPDIWTDPHIAILPVEQVKVVQEYLATDNGFVCISIDDYPVPGQDWIEVFIICIANEYGSDSYLCQVFQQLRSPNMSSLSAPTIRNLALRDMLNYLSGGKRLILYISRPIFSLSEYDFEHLSGHVSKTVGIICHASSLIKIPSSLEHRIRYHEMRKKINPDSPVYFSYSRDDSTALVNIISQSLASNDILYSLDMVDVKVQSSIKEYEMAIGNGETVIVVLSDNYFESPDCMYEMAALTKRGEINKRVIFVSHFQSVKRKKESHDLILDKWKAKYDSYRDIDPSDSAMTLEMNNTAEIIQAFPEFWKHVVDDVAISSEEVEKDSASSISNRVLEIINLRKFANKTPTTTQVSDPVNSGDTPTNTVIQMGNNSISIGTVNGNVTFGSN